MAEAVLMPKIGISVESCIIGTWLKKPGDHVRVGDALFSYETDKAAFECESTAEGELLEVFYGDGEEAPVLTAVCAIGKHGEDVSSMRGRALTDGSPATAAAAAPVPAAPPAPPIGISPASADAAFPSVAPAIQAQPAASAAAMAFAEPSVTQSHGAQASASQPAAAQEPGFGPMQNPSGSAKASPRARQLAAKYGVDATSISPTGPGGRVIERDVRSVALASGSSASALPQAMPASAASPAPAQTAQPGFADWAPQHSASAAAAVQPAIDAAVQPASDAAAQPIAGAFAQPAAAAQAAQASLGYVDEKMPPIRRSIASAMTSSLATAAQLTHHHSFDATQILALRAELKAKAATLPSAAPGLDGVTVGDMALFAVTRTLKSHPYMNACLIDGSTLRRHSAVHLGVAVDTPRGLMVPTVFNADSLTLLELSQAVKALAAQARSGSISPDALRGATFTVSNLGAVGVESFTPILNPPQIGIVGLCGMTDRVRTGPTGLLEAYKAIGVSLTYDHRAVDGAPASRFAQALCKNLESFQIMLAM